jgi:hypothetical protein
MSRARASYPAAVTGAPDESRARFFARALWGAGALLVLALGVLAAVLYGMPAAHWSYWGAGAPGARHFGEVLGVSLALSEQTFVALLRACLVGAWLAYGAAVAAARAAGGGAVRARLGLVAALAGVLAVLFPPALSCDVYAYVGFARMPLVHGLDPYRESQLVLRGLGDPAAPFLQWDLASPYGPLWTALSMALVAPVRHAPLLVQVLAFKLAAAAALIGLAAVGGRVAERLAPGRGPLAVLAIGLNPLLLVEGPGTGHNDLILLLPLLGALLAALRGRFLLAALLVGLSVGIKLVTLVVVPWLLILRLRAGGPWRHRLGGAAAAAALSLAPTLALLALAWSPAAVASSLLAHFGAHVAPGTAAGALLQRRWPLALVFAGCALWVYRRPSVAALQGAWVVFASAFILVGLEIWYPWYFSWPLALALVRWDGRASLGLAISSNVLALTLMSFYARV